MEGFEEVIEEFLVESYESLDRLDDDLMALEDAPKDRDRLSSIFRTIHTIKGTSGFLALPKLERVAHVGESLLVPLRDGEFDLTRDMADSLLQMVDAIRDILQQIEAGDGEGDEEYADLVEKLEILRHGGSGAPESQPTQPATTEAEATPQAAVPDEPQPPIIEPVQPMPADAPEALSPANSSSGEKPASESADRSRTLADSNIRINVELLDKLMNLVGELVLARNQILQYGEKAQDPGMIAASQRLNLITTELQEGVMKTRMQPIRNAWSKLPRVVRDLSATCGKNVNVKMEGADTELDKTILEAIKDPLTHIVRNSVDHGIESTEVRAANGKSPEGLLLLRAFHEGGQVNIEISDDGGGISADRVRNKAIEKKLITADQANRMTDRELINLILLPGFSTAEKVTNVSGRGVGMDVVKTNIERIGGTLDIQSAAGQGTTLRIKIPLTLAIVPALIITTCGDQYAIPQVSLLELVRLDGDRVREQIEFIHDTPVYRLRGALLPLVYLDEQLGLTPVRSHEDLPESANIVVLQAEESQFGLVVDTITDTQEIVVKPLGLHLKNVGTYAGATIMGDGTVALILDVVGLAQRSKVIGEHADHTLKNVVGAHGETKTDQHSFLIVDPGDGTRAAVALSAVARLEEFDSATIERSGHNDVVQYRQAILPLIYLGGYAPTMSDDQSVRLNTIVYTSGQKSVGVVVGKIMDIVHQQVDLDADGRLPSRFVIQERVTEVIDLPQLVLSNHPEMLDTAY